MLALSRCATPKLGPRNWSTCRRTLLARAVCAAIQPRCGSLRQPAAPGLAATPVRARRITEEATRPKALADGEADDDRVFELADDGSVRTVYPRMSLFEMREDLPRLVEYFRDAAFRKLEVAIVD